MAVNTRRSSLNDAPESYRPFPLPPIRTVRKPKKQESSQEVTEKAKGKEAKKLNKSQGVPDSQRIKEQVVNQIKIQAMMP